MAPMPTEPATDSVPSVDTGPAMPPVSGAIADGLLAPSDHPIRLPAFEGPLDLLLYLIRKNELDIYDIPIETVTRQYLEILRTYERNNLELAGDFFIMAATLMYIKSRMLLPVDTIASATAQDDATDDGDELDPRWELVQQLIQYKKIKECASRLDDLILERQGYLPRLVSAMPETSGADRAIAPADRIEIWNTFNRILQRLAESIAPGEIRGETVTISSRMEDILLQIQSGQRFTFSSLLPKSPTVAVLVSTFLACLELARLGKLFLSQDEVFDEIYCDVGESSGEVMAPAGEMVVGS